MKRVSMAGWLVVCMVGWLVVQSMAASQRVRVIIHTKPPQQEDFQCHQAASHSYTGLAASTYIDFVAYNSEPCTCWFESTGRIRTKMLRQGKYTCYREFQLHDRHMDLFDCPMAEGIPNEAVTVKNEEVVETGEWAKEGDLIAGERLLTSLTKDYVMFLGNSSHSGSIDSSLKYEFLKDQTYTLSSIRIQANSTMDIMCGIPDVPPSLIIFPTTTPTPTTTTTTTTTTTPQPTTEEPTEAPILPAEEEFTTLGSAFLDPTTEGIAVVGKDGGSQAGPQDWRDMVVLGMGLPALIALAFIVFALLLMLLIIILCCSKRKKSKKDEVSQEVMYHLVPPESKADDLLPPKPSPPPKLAPKPQNRRKSNMSRSSYEFRDIDPDPDIGSEEYEFAHIRIIPGSGDELALHQGAPPEQPDDSEADDAFKTMSQKCAPVSNGKPVKGLYQDSRANGKPATAKANGDDKPVSDRKPDSKVASKRKPDSKNGSDKKAARKPDSEQKRKPDSKSKHDKPDDTSDHPKKPVRKSESKHDRKTKPENRQEPEDKPNKRDHEAKPSKRDRENRPSKHDHDNKPDKPDHRDPGSRQPDSKYEPESQARKPKPWDSGYTSQSDNTFPHNRQPVRQPDVYDRQPVRQGSRQPVRHPTNGYSHDRQPTDGYPQDRQPTDGYPQDRQPTNGLAHNRQPSDGYAHDRQPTDGYSHDRQPSNGYAQDRPANRQQNPDYLYDRQPVRQPEHRYDRQPDLYDRQPEMYNQQPDYDRQPNNAYDPHLDNNHDRQPVNRFDRQPSNSYDRQPRSMYDSQPDNVYDQPLDSYTPEHRPGSTAPGSGSVLGSRSGSGSLPRHHNIHPIPDTPSVLGRPQHSRGHSLSGSYGYIPQTEDPRYDRYNGVTTRSPRNLSRQHSGSSDLQRHHRSFNDGGYMNGGQGMKEVLADLQAYYARHRSPVVGQRTVNR